MHKTVEIMTRVSFEQGINHSEKVNIFYDIKDVSNYELTFLFSLYNFFDKNMILLV